MTGDTDAIPRELKETPQWVAWRWVTREGKRTKPPFDPVTGRPGDATDPSLWMTHDRALEVLPRFDGIGFAVTAETPYSGVDLDDCLDEAGDLAPWAEAIVRKLDSYTEVTPSGRGVRVWVRGKLPPGRRRKGPVEMYDRGRYFTVTGRHWPGTPREIRDRAGELAAVHAEVFGGEKQRDETRPERPAPPALLSDDEILRKAQASRKGEALAALLAGDTSAHGGDESAADLALCSRLAFWFGGDVDAIDRAFRRSGLYREKWERKDYRDRTIAKALEGTAFYDPEAYRKNGRHAGGANGEANGAAANGAAGGGGRGGMEGPAPAPRPGGARGGSAEDPHRLARLFLKRPPAHPDGPTVAYWNEEWHRWDGRRWRVVSDREVSAEVTNAVKAEFDRIAARRGAGPRPVTTKGVANVTQALRGLALVTLRRCPGQPAWVGPAEPGEDLPAPCEVLPAANALVHLPSFVAGEPCTLPLTPRFFSPMTLGYGFDPTPPEPAAWLDFLGSVWPDDPESIAGLQEWFGYLLVPDTSLQKILMLIGPPRSGKGTVVRLLRALVGPDNVTAPTLSGLATNFGMAPLIGKTVAVIADARLSGRADSQVIVERLLSISGEDAQTIDRKHLAAWTGRLPTRFVLVSNEMPRLGDSSGALASRMVLLRMTRSFLGREDTTLESRLMAERTSILVWAIAGWARLRARGRFTQPESGRELADEFEELSSPISGFIEERCATGPGESVPVKRLYDEWLAYCKDNGREHPGDVAGFGRSLHAALPGLRMHQPRRDGRRVREYQGIALKPEFPGGENRPF